MQTLEYVVTIAEEQNLLKASEKLSVSPSALSQSISKLEAELRTPLFVRSRTGWAPTAAGQIYIDMARKIIETKRHAYREISLVSEAVSSSLSLGISAGRVTSMLAACFPAFNARFPNIKLKLVENPVYENIKQMRAQKIDFSFLTAASDFSDNKDLEVQKLKSEPFVIAIPGTQPPDSLSRYTAETTHPARSLSTFKDREFILMQKGTTIREAQDQLFKNAGFEPKVVFESGNIPTLYELTKNGYAATILPASYATNSSKSVFFAVEDPLCWNLFVGYNVGHKLSAAEEYLIELAREYYQNHL